MEDIDWKSPMCFDAQSSSILLRKILKDLKYKFKREASKKTYSQIYFLLAVPRMAYVFRFRVKEPSAFTIDLYDTNPGTSGMMSYIEVSGINEDNIKDVRRVLKEFAKRTPRKPWEFTIGQRVMLGILSPEFFKARKAWKDIGIR